MRASGCLLILPILSISAFSNTAQIPCEAPGAPVPPDSVGSCKAEGPVLTNKTGKIQCLDTDSLVKRSAQCVAPKMPAMAQQTRIEAQVTVNLVDGQGTVACVYFIRGHPLLAAFAIDAAKDWTFRPMKKGGKSLSFYGHVTFYYSTTQNEKNENPCTIWEVHHLTSPRHQNLCNGASGQTRVEVKNGHKTL